jgi:hypothetical protein
MYAQHDEYGNTVREGDLALASYTQDGKQYLYEGKVVGHDYATKKVLLRSVDGKLEDRWFTAHEISVQLTVDTPTYTELRETAQDPYIWSSIIVLPKDDQGNLHDDPLYVIAIGRYMADAMRFVESQYGVSVAQQQSEIDDSNMAGDNGKIFVNYIATDGPGDHAIFAMQALFLVGYDTAQLIEDHIVP